MGKPTGFLEYGRKSNRSVEPKERIQNFEEFHVPLPEEERRCQGARCMDCGVPFCQSGMVLNGMVSGCPLHNLIPEWNDLIYRGNGAEAYSRLRKTNNFPEFTGRVCPALCEAACTDGLNGDPVAIRDNEYAIVEAAWAAGAVRPQPPEVRTGKKVAVIGSGPAGMAAADELNRRGHLVTVYERDDRVGGLLMYGIPNMKLDKQVVLRRVGLMQEEGVTFFCGEDISTESRAEKLKKEYDCVLLACGAAEPRDIKVPGRDAGGIHFAVDYLKSVTKSLLDSHFGDGKAVCAKGKHVVVIGGGDTGNDCVGTAIRQGAASVVQLEMMPKPPEARAEDNPWPEWPKTAKTDYGQEEAAAVFGEDPRLYCTTATEFVKGKDGKVEGVRIVELEWRREKDRVPNGNSDGKGKSNGKPGRLVSVHKKESERVIPAELVLIAAGFLGAQGKTAKAFGLELDERQNVGTGEGYATSVPGVFAAGDMRRGQSLVAWAIREGREAAEEIDRELVGYGGR